jgi:monoamine oxidase
MKQTYQKTLLSTMNIEVLILENRLKKGGRVKIEKL